MVSSFAASGNKNVQIYASYSCSIGWTLQAPKFEKVELRRNFFVRLTYMDDIVTLKKSSICWCQECALTGKIQPPEILPLYRTKSPRGSKQRTSSEVEAGSDHLEQSLWESILGNVQASYQAGRTQDPGSALRSGNRSTRLRIARLLTTQRSARPCTCASCQQSLSNSRSLCESKIGWDEPLPEKLSQQWQHLSVKSPRRSAYVTLAHLFCWESSRHQVMIFVWILWCIYAACRGNHGWAQCEFWYWPKPELLQYDIRQSQDWNCTAAV